MRGDGEGWLECAQGHRHWGRYGAAGLLVRAVDEDSDVRVLLQLRASWSADGNTWGIPGGARDSDEHALAAAQRETQEETGIAPFLVRARESFVDDHGGWSYTTVIGDTPHLLPVTPCRESADLAWVREEDVESLPLHPGFASSWVNLRARPVTLLVDTANVIGSRPDGWWRDRAAATDRFAARCASLRARVTRLPDGALAVVRRLVLVVEGDALSSSAVRGDGWPAVAPATPSATDATT